MFNITAPDELVQTVQNMIQRFHLCVSADVKGFYRNGVLLDMGGAALSLEEADEEIKQFIKVKFIKNIINNDLLLYIVITLIFSLSKINEYFFI